MEVEKLAFGYDKEAELVAELLADNTTKPIVSLLAFYKDEPIGHILFTSIIGKTKSTVFQNKKYKKNHGVLNTIYIIHKTTRSPFQNEAFQF